MYLGILLINVVFLTICTKYYLSYSVRLYAKAFKKKFPKQYEILAIFLKKTSRKIVNKNNFLRRFLSNRDETKIEEHEESKSVKVLESLKTFEKIGYGNRKIKKIDERAISSKKCGFLIKK